MSTRPGRPSAARHRPVVIITSNNEKELPDAFLRRCFFHYIRFPDRPTMERIVAAHYPNLQHDLAREALNACSSRCATCPGLKKKPATSELLDWLKLLMIEDMPAEALRSNEPHLVIPPLHGALLKNEQDVHLFERLAFLKRRGALTCSPNSSWRSADAGVPASITEYLALLGAMKLGVADHSVEDFYFLSRATLVKDERHLDRFDQVFGHVFRGLETAAAANGAAEVRRPPVTCPRNGSARWRRSILTPEEQAEIKALGGFDAS